MVVGGGGSVALSGAQLPCLPRAHRWRAVLDAIRAGGLGSCYRCPRSVTGVLGSRRLRRRCPVCSRARWRKRWGDGTIMWDGNGDSMREEMEKGTGVA